MSKEVGTRCDDSLTPSSLDVRFLRPSLTAARIGTASSSFDSPSSMAINSAALPSSISLPPVSPSVTHNLQAFQFNSPIEPNYLFSSSIDSLPPLPASSFDTPPRAAASSSRDNHSLPVVFRNSSDSPALRDPHFFGSPSSSANGPLPSRQESFDLINHRASSFDISPYNSLQPSPSDSPAVLRPPISPAADASPFLFTSPENKRSSRMRSASRLRSSMPVGRSSPLALTPSKDVNYSDRFIPSRSHPSSLNFSLLELTSSPTSKLSPHSPVSGNENRDDSSAVYTSLLRTELFGSGENQVSPLMAPPGSGLPSPVSVSPERLSAHAFSPGPVIGSESVSSVLKPKRSVFRFKTERRRKLFEDAPSKPSGVENPYSLSPIGLDGPLTGLDAEPRKSVRRIARSPFKVLDAPALQDDFYLNLVDWSSQNLLAVGLGPSVYLWSAATSKVTKLFELSRDDTVCSVSWALREPFLSVGTQKGVVQIWDCAKGKQLRVMNGHRMRVGALAWNSNLISSGSRDKSILQRDIRANEDFVHRLSGHKSEVCGLKWSYDERELASGGNDNQLLVWNNANAVSPVCRFTSHQAAVKAIAWSPHQHGLLASGGGTADRSIRFWNTNTSVQLSCVDTGSQVCNLAWSRNVNELVSTHGFSQNQIVIWKYPTMSKIATLTGHTMRVLYLSISPDGQTIVTGAGDETLRFWNTFPGPKLKALSKNEGLLGCSKTQIR